MKTKLAFVLMLLYSTVSLSKDISISASLDYPKFFGDNFLSQYREYFGGNVSISKSIKPFLSISGKIDYTLSEFMVFNTFLNGVTPSIAINVLKKVNPVNLELGVGAGMPIYYYRSTNFDYRHTDIGFSPIVSIKVGIDLDTRYSIGLSSEYSYIVFGKPSSENVPYNTQSNLWKNGIYVSYLL